MPDDAQKIEDDETLVARISARDEDALRELHRRHAPVVFTIASRLVGRATAEEITQDVFVTLWTKSASFDASRGTLKNWLCQIARRKASNARRAGKARREDRHDHETALDHVADDSAQPDEAQWMAQRRDALRNALDALPSDQRTALTLAFFDELSHEQIAATLQTPLGTTKTRIRGAMKKLMPALLGLVTLTMLILLWKKSERDHTRTDRALQMVTSSDVVPLHLASPDPSSPKTHGSYRARAGVDLAVLTASALPTPQNGSETDAWIRHGTKWLFLGALQRRDDGGALLVAQDPSLVSAPDEIRVTTETHAADAPSGPIVIAWPSP